MVLRTQKMTAIKTFAFVLAYIQLALADPCSNATLLPSLLQRNVGYTLKDGEYGLCDRYLTEGWYSTGSSYVISSSSQVCGTIYPWHLNGSLPTKIGSPIDVVVCKNNRVDNNCSEPKTIKAFLCHGGEYVFYLSKLSNCPEAYCIEDRGIKSTNGTPHAVPPTLSASIIPEVVGDVLSANKANGAKNIFTNEMILYCDFKPDPGKQYFYTITWHLSSGLTLTKHIWTSDPVNYTNKNDFRRKTGLKESVLNAKGIINLGFKVVCSVAASHKVASLPGPPRTSGYKLIGIEILQNTTVFLKNKMSVSVSLKLTVPFGCSEFEGNNCFIDINVFMPDAKQCSAADIKLQQKNVNGCGLRIYRDQVNKLQQLTLQGQYSSQTPPQERVKVVRLVSPEKYTAHPIFQGYFLDPIMVKLAIDDAHVISGKTCYSHNDPHMRTFDGVTYENQNSGTFILYKNRKYNVQVQIQTRKCPNYQNRRSGPWCNCGAAVAVGKDVFVVNNCNLRVGWDIGFKNCGDGVLKDKVFGRGKNYDILLPTGGEVHIKVQSGWTNFINVEITPSVWDYGKSTGLCGLFDNNKANDRQARLGFTTDHNLSWRVSGTESLFVGSPYNWLNHWDETENLCTCKDLPNSGVQGLNPTVTCEARKVKICKYSMYSHSPLQCSLARKKRQAMDDDYDIHSSLETSLPVLIHEDDSKRDKRSIQYDRTSARRGCLQALNTTAFQLCETVPGLDINPYINDCVEDALASDSMDWALTHLEGVKSHCLHQVQINQPLPPEVLSDPNFRIPSNGSEKNKTSGNNHTTIAPVNQSSSEAFSPEFLNKLQTVSCINECSGNGICSKGTCKCNPGFSDPDCSIDLSKPPVMRGIPDKGLCDLTQRICGKTSVLGDNFAESSSLMCKIAAFDVSNESSIVSLTSVERPGTRLSFAEVSCRLQDPAMRKKRSDEPHKRDNYIARGYSISISNDGVNFGTPDSIVIFDSTCVNCTKLGTKVLCLRTPGFCMLNGHCVPEGQTSGCEICGSSGIWYKGPDCPIPPASEPEKPKLWVIGAVLGVAVAVVGFAIILYICKMKTKKLATDKDAVAPSDVKFK